MKPKLRELQITPTQEGYALSDPLGFSGLGLGFDLVDGPLCNRYHPFSLF